MSRLAVAAVLLELGGGPGGSWGVFVIVSCAADTGTCLNAPCLLVFVVTRTRKLTIPSV